MTWIAPLLGATRDAPGMTARLFVRWVRRSAFHSGGVVEETDLAPARDGDRLAVRWHPWTTLAGFAVIVHFAWEMAQMPLYRMDEPSGWRMVGGCTQATFGDAIITLLAYATAAVLTGRRLWLVAPRALELTTFFGVGIAMTVGLEWWNVSVLHSWSYSRDMPSAAGIGLSPLVQWIVLPPLILWLTRRHLHGGQ